jgi:DNA-binding IclR family transcriptional regulator
MSTQKDSVGTSINLSAKRLLTIMEFMAQQSEPCRLTDIATALNLNASTTLRFLNTLVQTGYVAQDELTNRYYLTYKICSLAEKQMEKLKKWSTVRPDMEQITKLFGETCCLGIEKDGKVIYVEVVESPDSMIRSMQRIGNVAPMYCTGIGKLLLTNYSEDELDNMIKEADLQRFTDQTITTKEKLKKELMKVRDTGRAYDNQECEIGARCVALPVRDSSGKIVAGISVTGPAVRLSDDIVESKIGEMQVIVNKISKRMGYVEDNVQVN